MDLIQSTSVILKFGSSKFGSHSHPLT